MTEQLPIISHLQRIRENLKVGNLVLSAAPGAGKSTALLLDLLHHFPTKGKRILVLQPRRVTVRALAQYLSDQLGESIGQQVGYQIRGESKVSSETKLEFVTEAILTRRLQADPELSDVALIVFDEFHERNVHSDFGLALALESQSALREDLRLLVMSATLDMQSLMSLMPDANHTIVEGRQFPITFEYRPLPASLDSNRSRGGWQRNALEQAITRITIEALDNHSDDILVFMPSIRAIQITCELLNKALDAHPLSAQVDVLPLYGALSRKEQQRAIAANTSDRRKIVVATNVAETSLTIDGIGVVVDSGLERRLEIDLRTDIEGLVTKPISHASAYQRAGRAGRLGPGYCYRLWSQESHSRLAEQAPPEITQRDVSDLVIHALAWGTSLSELPLLTQPTSAQLQAADKQLRWLGAVDEQSGLMKHGRELLNYPMSLRLAHMQITVAQRFPQSNSWATAAVAIAVFLEGFSGRSNRDITTTYFDWLDKVDSITFLRIERALKRQAKPLKKQDLRTISYEQITTCVTIVYPDWLGFHVGNGKYKLANGKQAMFTQENALAHPQWLCIGGLMKSHSGTIQITLHQAIDDALEKTLVTPQITTQNAMSWNTEKQRFQRFQETRLGEIIIQQQPLPFLKADQDSRTVLLQSWKSLIITNGFSWLPMGDSANNFLRRCRIAELLFRGDGITPFPDFSELGLIDSLDEWLIPYLENVKSVEDLKRINWKELLSNRLQWDQKSWIDQQLPNQFLLPTGDKVSLDYANVIVGEEGQFKGPIAAARMQLLYGLQDSPMLADGQLPITFELLSPAHRPLQTTSDLAKFWQSESYIAIKKEMKGRYPKHLWPDDPANTAPTKRTKKHST